MYHVVLDTGVLGMVTHSSSKAATEPRECRAWLEKLLSSGASIIIPEIADYELRRELLRLEKSKSIARLDSLKTAIRYLPITTPTMLRAAALWAEARRGGLPTADPKALDADVILSAQTLSLTDNGDQAIVATTNVDHLTRFVDAREWRDIH